MMSMRGDCDMRVAFVAYDAIAQVLKPLGATVGTHLDMRDNGRLTVSFNANAIPHALAMAEDHSQWLTGVIRLLQRALPNFKVAAEISY